MYKAFACVSAEGQRQLEQDLIDLIDEVNTSDDSRLVISSEYVEVIIVKK